MIRNLLLGPDILDVVVYVYVYILNKLADLTQEERLQKAIDDRKKKMEELRRRFYIADGGFTDLRNLWNYEEGQLKLGREFECWHRLHDFWLLTGIITYPFVVHLLKAFKLGSFAPIQN